MKEDAWRDAAFLESEHYTREEIADKLMEKAADYGKHGLSVRASAYRHVSDRLMDEHHADALADIGL